MRQSLVSTVSRSDRMTSRLHTFEDTQRLVNQASSTFHYKTVVKWIVGLPLSSRGSACAPVATPVTITPSERKNSAARAVSSMLMSDVRAWELWDRHTVCLHKLTTRLVINWSKARANVILVNTKKQYANDLELGLGTAAKILKMRQSTES